ncbi:armadillo repeat-containing protein 1-like isoform X2 [Ostrea edulis]|nr:armadillo repeat-containing protein 1-like isoform X2 [Ostrea edulis]XP_048760794.1 armadillo repeat-containing protein 1-like isoform X2 [Ostrea edulis]
MGGLIMVLSNSDSKIVISALETLILMADTNDHKKTLRDFIGMMEQLEAIINSQKCDTQVHSLAEKLYVMITETSETPLKDTGNSRPTSRKNSACKNRSLQSNRTRHITLQIKGLLDKTDRDVLLRLILQVKGVISVTFDMNKKRCSLRAKPDVKPEVIVQAVAKSMTMTAHQVVKDEYGVEVLVSFGANPQDIDKENTSLPDYLPEDPDSPKADSRSLARTQKDEKKSNWLSSAASFLTNSFYW